MRQNEQLKTINPFHAIASFLIFMSLFTASSSLQGALKKQSPKKNYVVRIFFRDFYDRRRNGKYDTKSVYNKSGFNENAKWDSILLLLQIVNTQKPKAWWFNNTDAPSSMVVLFRTKNKAKILHNTISSSEYSFITGKSKVEKYKSKKRFQQHSLYRKE